MTKEQNCCLCKEIATTAVRGSCRSDYNNFCSFHAGAIQMIFENLGVADWIKWRPLNVKNQ